MKGLPDFHVAEVHLEPDEGHATTLAHLQEYAAALPVVLDNLVDMWESHGWHGCLDGRPVAGSLERFDDARSGSILQSVSIERHGSRTLEVIVYCCIEPSAVRVTAQALTQEQAERIVAAARDAWLNSPPRLAGPTRLERAGHFDRRRWGSWVGLRRLMAPTGYVSGLITGVILGAVLTVLGITGWLEDAVRWIFTR